MGISEPVTECVILDTALARQCRTLQLLMQQIQPVSRGGAGIQNSLADLRYVHGRFGHGEHFRDVWASGRTPKRRSKARTLCFFVPSDLGT